jgi:hydroxyethylthiazole kinase-like uncharacterized protein yjeF
MELIVTPDEMIRIEQNAYQEGFEGEDFMEDAGSEICEWALDFGKAKGYPPLFTLLCGKGNNGGDTYVAGRYLLEKGCQVKSIQLAPHDECSPLLQKNLLRFQSVGGEVRFITHIEADELDEPGIILDGIFGTGFQGAASGIYAEAIELANNSRRPILSIDIPSGLDGTTGLCNGPAILATETIYLGLPKIGFFIREGWNHIGTLRTGDFGLPDEFIEEARAEAMMLEPDEMSSLLPKINRSRDKYQAGYVVALAGSPGMSGAANLASFAALRAGAGIVRLLHPRGMETEFSNAPYELVRVPYDYNRPEFSVELISKGSAVLIGPGVGRSEQTRDYLEEILAGVSENKTPAVIDADALFHIANDLKAPQGAILTPHRGEMNRLLKISGEKQSFDQSYWELCQRYAEENQVVLVVKGGPTVIFDGMKQEKSPMICPLGNPGMATAGSGDVLTGVIAGLLAQGLEPLQAAKLGVYLHAMSGDLAEEIYTPYSMVAEDLISLLPQAYRYLIDFPNF